MISTPYHFGKFLKFLHDGWGQGFAIQSIEELVDPAFHIVDNTFRRWR